MITTLVHGISIQSAAEGAIVQTVDVTAKKEISEVSGMKSGKTQIVKVYDHTETNEFAVTGKGDLTLVPGVGATSTANISLLTGGLISIAEFKYAQKLGEPSEWSYSGKHYPHAA